MKWLVGLVGLIVVVLLVGYVRLAYEPHYEEQVSLTWISPAYDEDVYLPAIADAQAYDVPENAQVIGGVVPHHLLASALMGRFFATVSSHSQPDLIVWLAPNHAEKGAGLVQSGLVGWETPLGQVKTEQMLVSEVSGLPFGAIDNALMGSEAAVVEMLPWLAHYFPDVPVMPVLFSRRTRLEQVEEVVEMLEKISRDQEVLVVASVDFSHYLTAREADEHDQESVAWMKERNYERLMATDTRHMDSPAALVAMLLWSSAQGSTLEILERENSGYLVGDPTLETTGYVSGVMWVDQGEFEGTRE